MSNRDYSLVSFTNTNLFFIDDSIIKEAGYEPLRFNNLDILLKIDQQLYKIACGYDGSRITFGRPTHPWDGSNLAKVYSYPKWAYGWEPTYFQLAFRALRTHNLKELIAIMKRLCDKR